MGYGSQESQSCGSGLPPGHQTSTCGGGISEEGESSKSRRQHLQREVEDVSDVGPSAAEGGGQATAALCLSGKQHGNRGGDRADRWSHLTTRWVTRCAEDGMAKAGAFPWSFCCKPSILNQLLAPAGLKMHRAGAQSRGSYSRIQAQCCSLHPEMSFLRPRALPPGELWIPFPHGLLLCRSPPSLPKEKGPAPLASPDSLWWRRI